MSNNQLVDSCLRVLQEKGPDMPQYTGQNDTDYHGSNGQADTHSLHSSHLSVQEDPLLMRSHKQQTSQQVTTVTKVVREVSHMEPDSGAVSYMSVPLLPQDYQHADPRYQADPYMVGYEHYDGYLGYPAQPGYPGPHGLYMQRPHSPHSPHSPSEHSHASPPHEYLRKSAPYLEAGYNDMEPGLNPGLQDHYRITPSPGGPGDQYDQISNSWNMDDSGEPSQHPHDEAKVAYGYVSPSPYGPVGYGPGVVGVGSVGVPGDVPVGYEEGHSAPLSSGVPPGMFEDDVHLQRLQARHSAVPGMASPLDDDQKSTRWRDPNLSEVIGFLSNPNNVIKANAAAYLQHLCYMDDPNKQKTRSLGGIPPLVQLLNHDSPDVYRNACGALRNLSYGRQNDENKRAIKNAGGVPALINLLRRTSDADVKELVTGVLWNLSSCEDLKRSIIDDGVTMVVNNIIIPHSGWDPNSSSGETCWSTVFRNASGVLRNVSSAGEYARKKLRECDGLVDALLYVVRSAIEKSNIGNKIVENCVCILRNLSYRCQEVEDPNYDKHPIQSSTVQSRVSAPAKGENLGCFGGSKKKKDGQPVQKEATTSRTTNPRNEPVKGMELLWQPEVVQSYLSLLQTCSNPETLEAAAGALQNLAACYWQPSIEMRAAVRKEKGLPILVELLRMEVDRVVCAVATALRNLAIDQRNKELIGKYAMRDLIQKLPSGNNQHDQGTSDDTIAAVLATLNEVIKKNAEFSRSLLDAGGVERLMNITRQRQKYTPRVLKFAGQVLFTMWQHQELRDVYKKHGWKEQDFVTKTVAARNSGPNSPNNANSTLNRPMASQGSTRYEDRTMQRPSQNSNNVGRPTMYQQNEELAMSDMQYPKQNSGHAPPAGGVCVFPSIPDIILHEFGWLDADYENSKSHENRVQQSIFSHPLADFAALFIICIILGICVLLTSKPDKDEEECLFVDESNRVNLPEDRTYKLPPTLNASNFSAASGDASSDAEPGFIPVHAEEPEYPSSRASLAGSHLYNVHHAHSQSTQTSNRALRRAAGANEWLIRRTRSGHIYGKYPML